ncbi:MAG: hypothetical protein IIU26_00970 [Clostridium sp.]|nr:hypothetical protein [Clostridium sp.]MBQ5420779.1 hypothetical protein [Clostridium sp.]HAE81035.1 hypothetical protein [Lachnoclostridium sp.]
MKVYEDYTIKGPWQEGDPDRVLETIYREMNRQNISTAVVTAMGKDRLQLQRYSDPYDYNNSLRQFHKTEKIIAEKLTEAGYSFSNGEEEEE